MSDNTTIRTTELKIGSIAVEIDPINDLTGKVVAPLGGVHPAVIEGNYNEEGPVHSVETLESWGVFASLDGLMLPLGWQDELIRLRTLHDLMHREFRYEERVVSRRSAEGGWTTGTLDIPIEAIAEMLDDERYELTSVRYFEGGAVPYRVDTYVFEGKMSDHWPAETSDEEIDR